MTSGEFHSIEIDSISVNRGRVLGLEINSEFAALARLALEGAEDLGEAGDEVDQGKQERSGE
jgi:hypothetical protein